MRVEIVRIDVLEVGAGNMFDEMSERSEKGMWEMKDEFLLIQHTVCDVRIN